ncbi:hypothetical protein BS78_02G216900 [Paspalum vaginatum]|nr:hypothetical protein BS78_02G216900 [Paspalum vaginatum]
MPRALASVGVAAAASFGPPWLAVLGVAVLSVWVITLPVLLCGETQNARRKYRYNYGGAEAAAAATYSSGGGCGGNGGGCGGGNGGGCGGGSGGGGGGCGGGGC